MDGRIRLVGDPPDAPLDPVRELAEGRDALRPLETNPMLSEQAHLAIRSCRTMIETHMPLPGLGRPR